MIKRSQILEWLSKKAEVKLDGGKNYNKLYDTEHKFWSDLPNLNKKDKQLDISTHGGGGEDMYALSDTAGKDAAIEFGTGTIDVGNMRKHVKDLSKEDIERVHSIACNVDGGGDPRFYEKMLGKDLKEVTMTPDGHYGVFGQQFTNVHGHANNAIQSLLGIKGHTVAPQHVYQKTHESSLPFGWGDKWEDKGEHHTAFDTYGLPAIAGGGIAALAYGLYKKKQQRALREKQHGQVMKMGEMKAVRKQIPTADQVSRVPSAVIIQGNQDYIRGNKNAHKFYNEIAQFIREKGYAVTMDDGESGTPRKGANIWVAHGGHNAPKGTKVLNIPQYPNPFMTKSLLKALDRITTKQ